MARGPKTPHAIAIGRRVRELRKAKDVTQVELAVEIGIERGTLAGIEAGNATPGRSTLAALSRFFAVPMDYLETGTPLPGLGKPGDAPQNEEEVALLYGWRALDRPQQDTVARLMALLADTGPPTSPERIPPVRHRSTTR